MSDYLFAKLVGLGVIALAAFINGFVWTWITGLPLEQAKRDTSGPQEPTER